MDDIAKKGKKHEKIDQRGRLEFPALNGGKSGGGVVTNNAADGILNEDPNEIKVAIGYMNNFAFSCGQPERWERALSKIPFVVHITTNASEFSWFSDILLPNTHHMFEKWGYVKVHRQRIPPCHPHAAHHQSVGDYKTDETEIPWLIAEKLAERGFDNLLRHFKTYKDPETGKEPTNAEGVLPLCLETTPPTSSGIRRNTKAGTNSAAGRNSARSVCGTPIRTPSASAGAR